MQTLLIVLIGLHILAGVFWAGSTFAVARSGGAGAQALFRPQMGAATITVLAGIGLWGILHRGGMGPMEHTLALGAVCAIAAAGVQGATHKKNPLKGQRIAAGLLAIAVLCMAIARFVGF
ncbi:MAG: hypothetical protein ACJ8R9_27770 [Steroidobacteraceae bacterium]